MIMFEQFGEMFLLSFFLYPSLIRERTKLIAQGVADEYHHHNANKISISLLI